MQLLDVKRSIVFMDNDGIDIVKEFTKRNYENLHILPIPFLLLLFWVYKLFSKTIVIAKKKTLDNNEKSNFLMTLFFIFGIASVFFTLFFLIDRYFIVFIPIALLVICYWAQEFLIKKTDYIDNYGFRKLYNFNSIKYIIFSILLISVFAIWTNNYFNSHKLDDEKYILKKETWLRMKKNLCNTDICKKWSIEALAARDLFVAP